jgi:hypothetical protein
MNDDRMRNESGALDEAMDRVVHEMTQARISDDAVSRVMARVRGVAAADAGTRAARGGFGFGFGVLSSPRVAWSAAAFATAVAVLIAVGSARQIARLERAPATTSGASGSTVSMARAETPQAQDTHDTQAPVINATSATNPAKAANAGATQTPAPARPRAARPSTTARAANSAAASNTAASRVGVATGDSVAATSVVAGDPDKQDATQAPAKTSPQNIKIDIAITEQSGAAKLMTKNLSVIVADHESSSIRSEVRMPMAERFKPPAQDKPVENWRVQELPLNVDVRPELLDGGRIKLNLTLDYRTATAPTSTTGEPATTAVIKKTLVAVLSDGKPLVISQSADAATDRKVTVEVKATIQK